MNKKRSWIIPLVVASAGLAVAARTHSESAQGSPLRPIGGATDVEELVPVQSTFDAKHWKSELTQADFGARKRAMQSLAAEARRDPAAREALKSWSKDGDPCLSWTAYLALDESGAQPQRLAPSPFDDWFHGGFGSFDPRLANPFGPRSFAHDPLAVQDLLREMQDSLDQLPPDSRSFGQGLSIQSGPDGVHVERRTTENGNETVETFEADSIEQLLELHPELQSELRLQPLTGGGDQLRSLLDQLRVQLDVPHSALAPGEVRTDVLGVMLREAGTWRGEIDGLEPGTGVYIENVLPGTIAEAVGVRPGDVIARLNGHPIRSAADVRGVLQARAPDEALEVEWFDKSGTLQQRTWKP